MVYGYARVSTKHQASDGNSLEYQEKQLLENGAQVVFKDAFTGTKASLPQFDKLIHCFMMVASYQTSGWTDKGIEANKHRME